MGTAAPNARSPLDTPPDDIDGWRALRRATVGRGGLAHLLADWCRALGGHVDDDGGLHLPSEMPKGLAVAEMLNAARCLGLVR